MKTKEELVAQLAPGTETDGSGPYNAENWSGRKELTERFLAVALNDDGDIVVAVDARCWMSRSADGASPVYAAVWINGPGGTLDRSGKGTAGGYGYHKASAAIETALRSAGVKLSGDIHGAGDSAVREALIAVARAAGWTGKVEVIE